MDENEEENQEVVVSRLAKVVVKIIAALISEVPLPESSRKHLGLPVIGEIHLQHRAKYSTTKTFDKQNLNGKMFPSSNLESLYPEPSPAH